MIRPSNLYRSPRTPELEGPAPGRATLRVLVLAAFAFCLASFGVPDRAAAQIDVGVVASTEGAGIEVGFPVAPWLRARLGATGYDHDEDFTAGDIRYNGEAELRWGSLITDFSPGGGAFHLSVGLVVNDHEINGVADIQTLAEDQFGSQAVQDILDLLPPGFAPGFVRAKATFDEVSPYAGLGFRSAKSSGLGFAFDLGVIYLGKAEVTITVDSDIPFNLIPNGEALLAAYLDDQEQQIEEDIEDYKYYPVARFSLFYRF